MRALLIVGLAACGGPSKATSPLPAGGERAPVTAADAVCPDDATLVASLTTLWAIAPPHKVELHGCAPGQFGMPGMMVTAWVDSYEPGQDQYPIDSEMRRVVLDAQLRLLAEAEAETIAPWYRAEGGGAGNAEMVDFDGDGVDEILEQQYATHGGSATEWITVHRVAGAQLKAIFSLQMEYDNGAAQEDELAYITCSAKKTIVASGTAQLLIVDGTVSVGPHASAEAAADCLRGRHTYGFVGTEFKELP